MYRAFYEGSLLLDLPLFTLIFFVGFFACMVAWVFTRRDDRFDRMARLPLADGSGDEK